MTRHAHAARPATRAGAGAAGGSGGDHTLTVMTWNLWDVPFVSTRRTERMRAVCQHLAAGTTLDVLGVQECWTADTRARLVAAGARGGLVYHHAFESGADLPLSGSGPGMVILSRYPIVNAAFMRYSVNGHPWRIDHWDYQAGKGVGLARLETPAGMVDVYVTHTIAQYDDDDRYKAHRSAQALEAAKFIRLTSRAPLVVLLADLNDATTETPLQIMTTYGSMRNAFSDANNGRFEPTYGIVGTPLATYAREDTSGQRCNINVCLDYVLYRARQCADGRPAWSVVTSGIANNKLDAVGGSGSKPIPFSDHFAVTATFVCHAPSGSAAAAAPPPAWHVDPADGSDATATATCRSLLLRAQDELAEGAKEALRRKHSHGRAAVAILIMCALATWCLAGVLEPRTVVAGTTSALLVSAAICVALLAIVRCSTERRTVVAVLSVVLPAFLISARALFHAGWGAVLVMILAQGVPVGVGLGLLSALSDADEVNGLRSVMAMVRVLLRQEFSAP